MKINIDDYILNKKAAQNWFIKEGKDDFNKSIAILACSTMVPCIVICFWLGEVIGWTPEVLNKIEMFVKFYGYTDIKGIPESYKNI